MSTIRDSNAGFRPLRLRESVYALLKRERAYMEEHDLRRAKEEGEPDVISFSDVVERLVIERVRHRERARRQRKGGGKCPT